MTVLMLNDLMITSHMMLNKDKSTISVNVRKSCWIFDNNDTVKLGEQY